MARTIRHFTGSAKPGQPNDRPPAPAGPPPPRWRMWLLPVGVLITLILLSIPHMTSTPTKSFSYSKFVSEVDVGRRAHGLGQPQWRDHRHVEGRRRLHQPDPDGHHRHAARPHAQGARRRRHRRRSGVGPPRGHPLLRPLLAARRLLHLDGTAQRPAAGRGDHGLRRLAGQGLRRGHARPHGSPTSPATKEPSRRWPRWSTS